MKSLKLFEAIGEIDDRFLTEAEDYTPAKARPARTALRWLSAAACLMVIAAGGLIYVRLNGVETNTSGSTSSSAAYSTAPEASSAAESSAAAAEAQMGSAEDASDSARENKLGVGLETAILDTGCELDGIRYTVVSDPALLAETGLPESPAEADRGDPLGETAAGMVYAYLPLAEVPAVRLLQSEEELSFLLCSGGAEGMTLGALYGFDGEGISAELAGSALPDTAGPLLAALVPSDMMPKGEAAAELSAVLPNGLSFRLVWYPDDGLLLLGEIAYPADGELADLLAAAL